jgi:hypothetical protein
MFYREISGLERPALLHHQLPGLRYVRLFELQFFY